jgi:Mg-chelatase subunit ChlD
MPYRYSPPERAIQARRQIPLVIGAPQIGIVLDRSGSMESIRAETIGGFNRLLEQQKRIDQAANLSLALFNDRITLVYDAVPIADVPLLSVESYAPQGGTALNDAIGLTVQALGKRASRLTPSLVIIITDGDENSSREFSTEHIRQMISYRRGNHDWEFLFLGPRSGVAYARSIGIAEDHIIGFDADSTGITRILDRLGTSLEAYRHGDPNFVLRLQSGD